MAPATLQQLRRDQESISLRFRLTMFIGLLTIQPGRIMHQMLTGM